MLMSMFRFIFMFVFMLMTMFTEHSMVGGAIEGTVLGFNPDLFLKGVDK